MTDERTPEEKRQQDREQLQYRIFDGALSICCSIATKRPVTAADVDGALQVATLLIDGADGIAEERYPTLRAVK